MKPILIDTNAYVAITKGDRNARAIIQSAPHMGISVIVLGELLAGFRIGKREKTNRETLHRFLATPRVELLPITENDATREPRARS
jgi:tRNA(fMet)-specific endonuclease VapC